MIKGIDHSDTDILSLPLTQSQLLIWMGQKLNPDTPLYNMVLTFELTGHIDVFHFKTAFQALTDRSDALRTVFREVDGIVEQQLYEKFPHELEILDFSTDPEPINTYNEWLTTQSQKLLDLSKCCFDAALVKISADKYIWYLNQHHLTTDAWSSSVIYRTMADLYKCSMEGSLNAYPKLPAFRQYINYENSLRTHQDRVSVDDYWAKKLEIVPDWTGFYGISNPKHTTRANRVSVDLGTERSARLRKLTQEKDIRSWTIDLSLFNIFTTILFAYLSRVCGQNRFTIGTPAHNRTTPDFKQTTGVFIEVLPIIADINKDDTFSSLLQRVKAEAHDFLRYAQPGVSSSDLSRSFNVLLNYIHANFSDFNGMGVKSDWVHANHCDPSHHLRLEVHDFDEKGSFRLDFDFNNNAVPESRQKAAADHFIKLLDDFIDDRMQFIADVDILSEKEKTDLLIKGNATKEITPSSETIPDIFSKQVLRNPESIAVSFNDDAITYAELDRQSNQLAHYLRSLGVQKETKVGLYMQRSVEMITGILGILKAGGAYLPMDPVYPAERLHYMLEDGNVPVLLTHSKLKTSLPTHTTKVVFIDDDRELIAQQATERTDYGVEPDHLAYVIYTSGSTGKPKGAMTEHRSVVSLTEDLHAGIYRQYDENLNVALLAPCVFDASVQQIFGTLLLGHTLHIVPESARGNGAALYKFYKNHKIDVSDGTPSHLRLLVDGGSGRQIPRHFIIGGEVLSTSLVQQFQQKFDTSHTIITNIYGVAECCVDSLVFDVTDKKNIAHSSVSIGKVLPQERVYLVNEKMQLQPFGTPGELVLGGNGVGRGYQKLEALSKERFTDDPYHDGGRVYKTGDLGRYLPDGNIEFIGRKDHQVKVRGHRIELGEIEHRLKAFKTQRSDIRRVALQQTSAKRCTKCLLTDRHPGVIFDPEGVCSVCREFESYEEKALEYFGKPEDFEVLMKKAQSRKDSDYDCMLLYSGGKDSSYVLYRLVNMGLKVLAFTFDNGFISKAAFDNIRRQTSKLGVDCIIEKTDRMNDIFVESLNTDHTVCSGCFKSLTSISTKIAAEKGINVIITGLSRGQIFDTKLSGLYKQGVYEIEEIEEKLLLFRKMFHAADDRTNRLLDIDLSEVEFRNMYFVDFFRYDNTPIPEIRKYLKTQDEYWRQPKDTGFCSSNCMMNDIGICVHSQEAGFHNYAAPLSWDVRLGISTLGEVLPEVESGVNEQRVNHVLEKIGFYTKEIRNAIVVDKKDEAGDTYLCAYFVANQKLTVSELRNYLGKTLPDYMIPTQFVQMESFSLTPNGKINRKNLPEPDVTRPVMDVGYVAPNTEIEEMLGEIWSEVLQVEKVGIYDDFLDLGGHSLTAIRLMTRINETFELELALNSIFEKPTVASLSKHIEETITTLLEAEEEV